MSTSKEFWTSLSGVIVGGVIAFIGTFYTVRSMNELQTKQLIITKLQDLESKCATQQLWFMKVYDSVQSGAKIYPARIWGAPYEMQITCKFFAPEIMSKLAPFIDASIRIDSEYDMIGMRHHYIAPDKLLDKTN